MIRQLVTSYVLLVTVALAAFTVPVAFTLTAQVRGDTEESVRREATTMALLLAGGDVQSRQALDRMVAAYQRETPGRIAVIPGEAAQGGDSARWGSGALVVTAPARASDGRITGAIRITYPTTELNSRLWRIWWFRAALAAGVIMVAALLGRLAARRLTRPLRQLNEMASKFSDGDLTARSPVTGPLETRTLARTLNLGAERLQTVLDAQRIFVADASHQLRTPLTALRLSLDNIADGVDDEFAREDIEQATAEVVRMSRLVNGLLVLADEDAKVTAAEPVPLAEVIADRLELWRTAGDERGVRFSSGPVDGRLRVLAGPGHLEQVLDNVLSNALAVSPDGATVRVTVSEAGGEVVLEVLDEGPGMTDAEKSRAFDRFWRGQGLTGRSGSGLGLAIVKRLVTGDGGSVALGDAPGGGLVVRVSLRAAPPRSGG
ncbi:ATP-binding protein [Actinomadura sp. 6N118]|uniref:HAMP domain-containing sensor histidine kinase n=1 Tax=Actinomadura sp. 6N118 TaxID=3375151 RepID=UPI0037B2147C